MQYIKINGTLKSGDIGCNIFPFNIILVVNKRSIFIKNGRFGFSYLWKRGHRLISPHEFKFIRKIKSIDNQNQHDYNQNIGEENNTSKTNSKKQKKCLTTETEMIIIGGTKEMKSQR